MQPVASIATPESDTELSAKYGAMGYMAKLNGKPRDPGHLGGMVRGWWLDGYDNGNSLGEGDSGLDVGAGGTEA